MGLGFEGLGFAVCWGLLSEIWGLWGSCLLFGCWICDCGLDICYGSCLESTQSFDCKEVFSGCHEIWGMGFEVFFIAPSRP